MATEVRAAIPRYRSHKEVRALKIGDELTVNADGSVTFSIADGGFTNVTVGGKVVVRYMPAPGDYYVLYDDGYESISPAKAFEEGYTRI